MRPDSKKRNIRVLLSLLILVIFSAAWLSTHRAFETKLSEAYETLPNGVSLMPVNVNEPYPSWLYYEATPGSMIEDEVLVWNGYEDKAADLELGARDAAEGSSLEEGGTYGFIDIDGSNETIGVWTVLSTDQIELEAKTFYRLPFTIEIPEDVTPDTYYGGLYADYRPENEQEDALVETVLRNGIRVIIKVTDTPETVTITDVNDPSFPEFPVLQFVFSALLTLIILFLIHFPSCKKS